MGRSWTQGPESTFAMLVADWKAQLRLEGHMASGSLENAPSTTTTSFSTSRTQEEPHGAVSSCWSQPAAVPPPEQEGASSRWLSVGRTLSATLHWATGVSCRAGGACPHLSCPLPTLAEAGVFGSFPEEGAEGSVCCLPPTRARTPAPCPSSRFGLVL